MHDGGTFGKVGAQTHAVGIADTHAGRHHIVDHARELVDRQHVHVGLRQARSALVGSGHHIELAQSEILDRERSIVGPHHIVEGRENTVQVQCVRLGQTHAQQVQTQIGVGGVLDRLVQLGHGEHGHAAHATRVGASPNVSSGYHTSRVLPAASMLARPQPHAVRCSVMCTLL